VRPVDQTTFGVPGGNCFSACVASILELPIEDVPYFMGSDGEGWFDRLSVWLSERGLYALYYDTSDRNTYWPDGYYILGGESVRGPHAVVAKGKDVVHDPHHSRAGLYRREDITVILPLDMGQFRRA
jgi:hypothetical protein